MDNLPKEIVELVHEAMQSGVTKEEFQQYIEKLKEEKNGYKRS